MSRGLAEKAFRKARDDGARLKDLIAGAKSYAAHAAARGDPRFVKHPATWLNAHCWLDELGPPAEREKKRWEKRLEEERAREERERRKAAENSGGDS